MFLTTISKRPASVTDKEHWLTSDGVHMKPPGDALMAIGVLRAPGVPDREMAAGEIEITGWKGPRA